MGILKIGWDHRRPRVTTRDTKRTTTCTSVLFYSVTAGRRENGVVENMLTYEKAYNRRLEKLP